eukprot:CAMPEP_0113698360 /NCGR_PEP_ID=MMETSP0038_2-20120614/22665_1 /TAXON_ID=2898 /ORGANISM="Cryptomonas paramecium" /LENGTH=385 /DNA_ID=CAMNT_0000621511 /DNA_START=136 /DNA_END=1289 /DNA_ORIENTATION=- /assembly_acc=CAM_ASM_000170
MAATFVAPRQGNVFKTEVVIIDSAETPPSAKSITSLEGFCPKPCWEHPPQASAQIRQLVHPDICRASNLLLSYKDLVDCTKLVDWKVVGAGPLVGSLVDDAKQFESFGGTSICFCDWLSNSGNLYITDLRLTFPTEAACQNYHEMALSANAEVLFQYNGDSVTKMVELEQTDSMSSLSHIGSSCHVFCGPTKEARSLLSSYFNSDLKNQSAEDMSFRIDKAMHLVYLFRVERVVCKLCVTAFNGLIPYGYALSLSQCCHRRMKLWNSPSHGADGKGRPRIEDKATLREIFRRRAIQRQMILDSPLFVQPAARRDMSEPCSPAADRTADSAGERLFRLNLFVAALGKGHVLREPDLGGRNMERLSALCVRVPKDQVISVEAGGGGG